MKAEERPTSLHPLSTNASRFEAEAHEIDLAAYTSHPIAVADVGAIFSEEQKLLILDRLQMSELEDFNDLPPSAVFMIEKILAISTEEALKVVREAIVEHEDDFNFPDDAYDLLKMLDKKAPGSLVTETDAEITTDKEKASHVVEEKDMDSTSRSHSNSETAIPDKKDYFKSVFDWELQTKIEGALIAYHSPYPEVRAVTDPYDDPSTPCETIRVYFIGYFWLCVGSIINTWFSQRQPSIGLPSSFIQIIMYPMGVLWAKYVPNYKIKLWKNYSLPLNPGPWSFKEQVLAIMIYQSGSDAGYAGTIIMTQKNPRFYNDQWLDFGYQILLGLSLAFIGVGLTGILRKFVCYPVKAMWPTILPNIAMNRALVEREKKSNINGWTISRFNFFFLLFVISFFYFWIPDFLFTALSTFNWITWIAPNNFNLVAITGSNFGLGLNPIPSFDWNVLSYLGPNATPYITNVNTFIGMLIGFFTIIGVYWNNHYWTAYLPINSAGIYDNTGYRYNTSHILNKKGVFDPEKYAEYGPPFYSAGAYTAFAANFALYPFVFVYEIVSRWSDMKVNACRLYQTLRHYKRSNFEGYNDPHSRMMSHYKEVPDLWYILVLVVSIVLGILCVELYPTETPVWVIFFAVGLNLVMLIPNTVLAATTSFNVGMNVIVELIIGYAIPGNPKALMIAKAFGYNAGSEPTGFIENLKTGHYIKIPPRAIFRSQIIAPLISMLIGLGILNFQLNTFKEICMPFQKQKFTCPGTTQFFSNSVVWGVIGPRRVFTNLYPLLKYSFLIGFLLVFPCYLTKRYLSRRWTKYFQPSVVLGGISLYAPFNLSYWIGSMYLSFFFMYYLRKYYTSWWEKYNYIFSTGLSSGIAFSGLIIFFALQYNNLVELLWWGNNVLYNGIEGGDGQQSLLDPMTAPDGYFGPRIGNFP